MGESDLPETLALVEYRRGIYDLFVRNSEIKNPIRRTSRRFLACVEGLLHYHQGEVEMLERGRIPEMTRLRVAPAGQFTNDELTVLEGIAKMHNEYAEMRKAVAMLNEVVTARAP